MGQVHEIAPYGGSDLDTKRCATNVGMSSANLLTAPTRSFTSSTLVKGVLQTQTGRDVSIRKGPVVPGHQRLDQARRDHVLT
jgi:hypothetical protein